MSSSVFPAIGTVLGICAVFGGPFYFASVGLRSPSVFSPEQLGPALVIMLVSVLAGLAMMAVSGAAGVAGGEGR